jgi:hypothetical protein
MLRPNNIHGKSITVKYRITQAEDPPTEHKMALEEGVAVRAKPDLWGVVISDGTFQGHTLAHEIGHLLNLSHRNPSDPFHEDSDGLKEPEGRNLMSPIFETGGGQIITSLGAPIDLDLAQLEAARAGKAFNWPPP